MTKLCLRLIDLAAIVGSSESIMWQRYQAHKDEIAISSMYTGKRPSMLLILKERQLSIFNVRGRSEITLKEAKAYLRRLGREEHIIPTKRGSQAKKKSGRKEISDVVEPKPRRSQYGYGSSISEKPPKASVGYELEEETPEKEEVREDLGTRRSPKQKKGINFFKKNTQDSYGPVIEPEKREEYIRFYLTGYFGIPLEVQDKIIEDVTTELTPGRNYLRTTLNFLTFRKLKEEIDKFKKNLPKADRKRQPKYKGRDEVLDPVLQATLNEVYTEDGRERKINIDEFLD